MSAWMAVLGLLLSGLVGLLGWRLLAPHLRRLQPEDTTLDGGWLWLVGFVVQMGITELLLPSPAAGSPDLVRAMSLQALAGVLAVGLMLVLIGKREHSGRGLGLRRQRGPPAVLVAVAGWLMFLPCFGLVAKVNDHLLDWLNVKDHLQRSVQMFIDEPAARGSVLAWVSMSVVIPACEEVMFRGALFGGLRRLLHPGLAIAVSAVIFGLAHGTTALLPAAALGAFLAWLYERTGSLGAPIIFHGMHNALTLLLVAKYPDFIR